MIYQLSLIKRNILFSLCIAVSRCALTKMPSDTPLKQPFYFHADYLDRYYPKANAICYRIFFSLTVTEIATALADLTALFGEKPWFYFADSPEKIKLPAYVEHIIDQFDLIDAFLRRMRVNPASHHIVEYKEEGFARLDVAVQRKMKILRDELKAKYPTIIADFYAVYFDYAIDLFNREVLSQSAYGADKRYDALEKILAVLRGTERESYYQEAIGTCKELKTLLHQHTGPEATF